MVEITVDGRQFQVEENTSVMKAARVKGIKIPGVCYHPALKPVGSCRLCAVEVTGKEEKPKIKLACALKVTDGMVVETQGELVAQARAKAFRRLVQMAPEAKIFRQLADECGLDLGPVPDGCIRCELCIRVCKEVVGAGALKMASISGRKLVVPISNLCIGCGSCVSICPTNVIHLHDQEEVRVVSIRDEVIGRLPLARCESCGRFFATRKFLDYVASRTTTHVDVKEHHAYCNICAKMLSDRVKFSVPLRGF
jgi:bidirectional [NiFe] hydrogenase diaphorase subunit